MIPSTLLHLLLATLFIASVTVLFSDAQMTFSDGWGKRSAHAPFALLADRRNAPLKRQSPNRAVTELFANSDEEGANNPAIDACHVGYAQRLVQLHEQMLALYSSYQQCQAKATAQMKMEAKP